MGQRHIITALNAAMLAIYCPIAATLIKPAPLSLPPTRTVQAWPERKRRKLKGWQRTRKGK